MADPSQEVIHHQMEETRAGLAQKLETLEGKVTETVQDATSVVSSTVESVKETVEAVKESVANTVESVKETVGDTVQAVKRAFDLKRQVDQHPWAMLGGSVAVGFLVGRLLPGRSSATTPASVPEVSAAATRWPTGAANGGYRPAAEAQAPSAAPAAQPREEGWLSGLMERFGPEISKLKGLALGAALGVVRDMVTQVAPEQFKPKVQEVVDSITTKLGGEPIRGPIAEHFREATGSRAGDGREGHGRSETEETVGTSYRR